MIVYHGGTDIIKHPIAAAGRPRLDFGQGFYVTDIKKQAESCAERMQRIREQNGIVNIYELDDKKTKSNFRYHRFDFYDIKWLEYIVSNRMGTTNTPQYDVIEGGIANDRVIDTIEAYMANFMTLETALSELAKHQPNNQLCIANQKVIEECLTFIDSYQI